MLLKIQLEKQTIEERKRTEALSRMLENYMTLKENPNTTGISLFIDAEGLWYLNEALEDIITLIGNEEPELSLTEISDKDATPIVIEIIKKYDVNNLVESIVKKEENNRIRFDVKIKKNVDYSLLGSFANEVANEFPDVYGGYYE